MKLRTPSFWYAPRGWASAMLAPAAAVYGLGRTIHARRAAAPPPLPVICVGNIVAGGSGKTPVARALMAAIRDAKIARHPVFITRGYGSDEARLLERDAPVIIDSDRQAAAAAAAAQGADIAIMDDGFQNPHIRAQTNIVVIDGSVGFGNRCLLPAGPLREPLAAGLARADAFVIVGEDSHGVRALLPARPVFTGRIHVCSSFQADHNTPHIGFAGLGRPEKFRETLVEYGMNVAAFIPFPDHHPYTRRDTDRLATLGRRLGATLITTEKDAVRLPPGFTPLVMPVVMAWDDEAAVISFLRSRL